MNELPQPTQQTTTDALLGFGFTATGAWRLHPDGAIELVGDLPRLAGVYAFAVDGVIRYIGVAQRGLHHRMGHYRRGPERLRTSHRINSCIRAALQSGANVTVLMATPPVTEWNGLPVNTTAGLELGLIAMVKPEWNMMGRPGAMTGRRRKRDEV